MQIADELSARDRLRRRGYTFLPCKTCRDYPDYKLKQYCPACGGRGGHWQAPMEC